MADQQKYMSKLNGSRILIVGGSSGIGYAVAEATIEYGANVTISSSNPQRVISKVEQLKKAYPSAANRVQGLTVDLSKHDTVEQEIENLFKNTVKALPGGKLDHVIFTAADALAMMELKDLSLDKIRAAGQLRFFAPLLVGKYVEQYLNKSPKSSYTITTGIIGEKPVSNWSVIAAYAGGHHAMVKNLALDLKPIRVNGVSPGVVDTEMWKMPEKEREAFFEQCAQRTATGVPGHPDDVAEAYLCALKDKNMDGTIIRTDGGGLIV